MHKRHNKFLILLSILVLTWGIYYSFHNDSTTEAATSGDDEGSLSSSLDTTADKSQSATNGSSTATEDTSFLMKLASLKTIKVDTSLFSNAAFNSLVDNNINLESAPYGRINPFSPVTTTTPTVATPTKVINPGVVKTLKTN